MQSRIAVITTGGTIAMRYDAARGGAVPAVSGSELVEAVPALLNLCDLEVEEFCNIPSFHMTPQIMLGLAGTIERLLRRDDIAGLVVTHGTDTLEETAYFLSLCLSSPKPVCLTGAMRSGSDISPDGPDNIFCAVKAACSPLLKDAGVLVVMNGEIHEAAQVVKLHKSALHAFASPNSGPVGVVDKSGITLNYRPGKRKTFRPAPPLPTVPIVKMYTGMETAWLDALLDSGVDGLVIEGFGLGNVPDSVLPWLERALRSGIPVAAASRVPAGSTRRDYAVEGGAGHLASLGVLLAGRLSSQKARLKLLAALGETRDRAALAALFAD